MLAAPGGDALCRCIADRRRHHRRGADRAWRRRAEAVARTRGGGGAGLAHGRTAPPSVTGGARYAADNHPSGVLYAVLAVASIARGRVTFLDLATAKAHPGVVEIMTPANKPELALDVNALGIIPMPADQNLCAQSRSPMDMIVHG